MTCIVALRKHGKVIMGSESLTTLENTKLVNVCNEPKLLEFKHFTMGIAGDGPLVECLEFIRDESYQEDDYDWFYHRLKTRQDCINFITHFLETFQERAPETRNEDLKYEFLFSNGVNIWWAFNGPSVFEIGTFWAAGSGAPYAIGYLTALYNKTTSNGLEKLVYEAIESSIKFDNFCEGPVVIKTIKKQDD